MSIVSIKATSMLYMLVVGLEMYCGGVGKGRVCLL